MLSEEVEAITEVEDLEPVDITIVSEILDNLVESISDTTVRVIATCILYTGPRMYSCNCFLCTVTRSVIIP